MRSHTFRIVVLLCSGIVITVLQTWAFAAWGRDLRATHGHHLSHEDGHRWRFLVDRGWGVTKVSLVPDNGHWGSLDNPTYDRSTIPFWSRCQDRPSDDVFNDALQPWNIELAYGWPFRSGWAQKTKYAQLENGNPNPSQRFAVTSGIRVLDNAGSDPSPFRVLPVRPILLGFAADTAIYTVMLALLVLGPSPLRRAWRKHRGRCPRCGYDLRHDFTHGCSECGFGRPTDEPR